MAYLGFSPLKIEHFGGLNSLIDPTNLPNYASPDCSDVEFLPGLVRTRPGLTSLFTALGGNPTVNYLKTYITPTSLLRALVLSSIGILYKENPAGTLASVATGIVANSYGNSVSLFGREYIAFGDGLSGIDIPSQFDDTNFDRVSQVGPGTAPAATDENNPLTVSTLAMIGSIAITASPNGLSEVGNIVTVSMTGTIPSQSIQLGDQVTIAGAGVAGYNGVFTVLGQIFGTGGVTGFTYYNSTSGLANSGNGTVQQEQAVLTFGTPHGIGPVGFPLGLKVVVSGAGVGGYNGTWTVRAIGSTTTITVVIATFGLGASGPATVNIVGNIVAGVHKLSVLFVTRNGYLTAPTPSAQWTSTGSKRVVVSNIPTGPPNVSQRILIFTATGGASFFYSTGDPSIFSSRMVIGDNTTTTATFDFSDTILLLGVNTDALFNLVELGECSGVTQYSSRLFWWGERNKIQNLKNTTFDGGFGTDANGAKYPLGWTEDSALYAGGGSAVSGGFTAYSGDSYAITGNGGVGTRGLMTQSAYQDAFGVSILSPATAYSVRARVARNSTLAAGTLHVDLKSVIGGFTTAGLTVTAAQAGTSYAEFTAIILTSQTSIPTDLILRVYADGTLTNNGAFLVDCIEIFPTNQPNNVTMVRASKVEDPESYDGVTGFLQIGENNGQAVRAGFVIRNNLYFVKERSFYVTQDDGVNEPNQWTVQEISQKVGTPSVRGVGLGDEWAIIAGVDGVYFFDGGEPQKISQEIQPTWDSINWSLGYLIDVKVDTKRKRIYIAVPVGASALSNNRILTLDYTDGFGDPNPTSTMNIAGIGRKWSPWVVACNSMNLILRADGTQQLWLGNGQGLASPTGKVYQLDATGTVFSDDGAAINSYWQSGYFQDVGRLVFGPLVANIIGVGACNLILRKGDQGWLTNLRSWILSTLGFRNMERMLNIETERLAVRFGTNAVGSHFSLQGLSLYAKAATFAGLRGVNF